MLALQLGCGFLWWTEDELPLMKKKIGKELSREMVAEVIFLVVERLFGFLHKSCFSSKCNGC